MDKKVIRYMKMRYGSGTGVFIDGDELRIGFEPDGIKVAITTGDGGFPIQYLADEQGRVHVFETKAEAELLVEATAIVNRV